MTETWSGPENQIYPFIIIIDPYTPVLVNALTVYSKDDVKRIKHNIDMRKLDAKHPCQLVMVLKGIITVLNSADDIPIPPKPVIRTATRK